MKSTRRTCGGMTLLEIMIVVSLIATLAGIVMYAISTVRERIRYSQAEQELARLASACEKLAFDTGKYPQPKASLVNYYGVQDRTKRIYECWDLSTGEAGLLMTNNNWFGSAWSGPYIDQLPVTDPWGRKYFFDPDYWPNQNYSYTNMYMVVGSFGPNGYQYDKDDVYVILTAP